MKKHIKTAVFGIVASAMTVGCMPLVTSEEFDNNGNYFAPYTMIEWLASEKNEQFTLYYDAVVHSGLEAEFAATRDKTFIIPTDAAMKLFLLQIGFDAVENITPSVLRDLLKYMVLPDRYISTEMEDAAVNGLLSSIGLPLYLTRMASSTNPYKLYVNTYLPEENTTFAGSSATVTMQDVQFSDNVAQVVDKVPYYAIKTTPTDTFNGTLITDKKATLKVNIDNYVTAKQSTSQAQKVIASNSERFPIWWYDNSDIAFADEIVVAKAYFYVNSSTTGTIISDFYLNDITDELYALTANGTDTAPLLNATYASYKPTCTADNAITTFTAGEKNKWFTVDISDFVKKHYETPSAERKPIGLSAAPVNYFVTTTGMVCYGYKIESSGSEVNNPSYIDVIGKVESRTTILTHNALACGSMQSVVLTKSCLERTAAADAGSYNLTPNNIIYSIAVLPTSGALTCNGLPLRDGSCFTQADINSGIVKYYNTAAATTDSFTLSGSDYTGSVVSTPIVMNVSIN